MWWMERGLTSRTFWMLRSCTVSFQLILIYGVEKMAEEIEAAVQYILGVPSEFVPMAMVIALAFGILTTFALSLPDFYEQDKTVARASGGKIVYGIKYLSANAAVIVACVVGTLVITGWYIEASGAVANAGLCNGFAFVISIVIGLIGTKIFTLPFVECARNKIKADEAREEYKASHKTE